MAACCRVRSLKDLNENNNDGAFKLTGEAKRWWNFEKVIREAEGTGVIVWAQFKQNFFDRFFPKVDREARAREFTNLVQGSMTVRQYAARFAELSRFAAYLIPDEERKTRKFKEELVHKAMLVEQNLKRGAELQEQRKRAAPQGFSNLDQGPWKKRNDGSSSSQRQMQGNHTTNLCKFCNRIHTEECRKEVGSCFKCGKDGHFIRECPLLAENNRRPNPPQNFRLYNQGNNQQRTVPAQVLALTPGEAEDKNDVITGNLIVFPMIGFDVILGMDWLPSSYASIDCFKKEVVFKFPEEEELRFMGSRGFLAFVVNEPREELEELEENPVVREYPEVFHEDLFGLPPEREVEFAIELASGTTPLSKAPYRMAPLELAELKEQLQDLLDKDFIRPSVSPWELQFWVFIDDILIYSKSKAEHEDHLRQVLGTLKDKKLFAKLKKCEFWLESIAFMRHVVSKEGISVDPGKIEAIVNWTQPTSVHKVRSFLGLAGYCRHFIDNFSNIAVLLTAFTRKNNKYEWTDKCEESFQELKKRLVTAPVLTVPSER
ncbi:uncharacterized protein LOC121235416 [Juglans microcarpa x Juglans regia]|uniref:uncharacterized protein LOC121235416 n=1 Tax=Juglans microcarpa x Juglans regia TaxID=2249226 RepID=UPI001B7F73A5|nr:uncharacterized protein LOC121235416 [Juglans microcarpa x Juglans regia]